MQQRISLGAQPFGVAVNPLVGNVYVANSVSYPESGSVGALNQSGTLDATISAGYAPLGIDVDFGTNLIFVANSQSNTVGIISGKTNAVTATLPVSSLFLAVNPVTQKVYVAPSANTPILTVVNEK
ncbi:YncE family protein [Silvibacterium dinghuense]|uniref:YncE family protein n=1 Tax=Silvibacterium dinghuense TaxID=1560006 RepID=A0A4Q1SFR2_9BACT|nr:hypothetical protein [Silvibacterium dinghuense]RXS96394.1 hypothetical protein ESZ00_00005 [Silvibacterium dinghuense]GGG90417.1 hypothetical protein GCM10011586_01050 [Silvibacterium dinghuense]